VRRISRRSAWNCRGVHPRSRTGLVAVLALWALAIQAILPLVHGPHGHAHPGHDTSCVTVGAEVVAGGSITQDDVDDCSLCPVCHAMHWAAQPLIPTLDQWGIGGLTLVAGALTPGRMHVLDVRGLTDAAPRGPPAAIAC